MVNRPTAPVVPAAPRPDGLVLAPFRALRFDPDLVRLGDVLAPPYDVIDSSMLDELERREPHNVVRLTLPRDDAGPGSRYRAAAHLLAQLRDDAVLRADQRPGLYVYEQDVAGHVQRGLVGAIGLTPATDGIVLPHENTMAGPVADRLALMAATEADLEPIVLVYDGGGAASRVVATAADSPALVDAVDRDGARHRLWAVTEPATLADVAADLHPRRAVIADGHHRYATFLHYQADRHAAGDGAGPWDLGLAFLVDATTFGPKVEPIHRSVDSLPAERAVELAAAGFRVAPLPDVGVAADALVKAGTEGTAFVVTDGERAWLLTEPDPAAVAAAMPPERSAAWRALDVTVAHHYLIRALWQLDDTEDVVAFHHSESDATRAAAADGGVALLLNPTPVAAVTAVAAAGERMPRKSTLFVPKPATGLLMRAFADD
jgi:uncharacterized protein (DUF1015 family)